MVRSSQIERWTLVVSACALAIFFVLAVRNRAQVPRTVASDRSPPDEPESTKALARTERRNTPSDRFLRPAPQGVPIAQTHDSLRARALSGDARAATELAEDLSTCRWMFEQAAIPGPTGADSPDATPEDRARDQAQMDYWNDAQEFIRRNSSFCAGLDVAEIDRLTSKALLAAAQLGDEEAAACFVSDAAFYARIDDGTKTYPAERDDAEIASLYKANVLHLAEHGVELGDWRMVVMLSSGFRPGSAHGGNLFAYRIAQPDGAKAFLYASLLTFAFEDPLQIQRIKETPLQADEFGITDDQARQLAAEAQRMFNTYFRDSGTIPAEGSTLCDM